MYMLQAVEVAKQYQEEAERELKSVQNEMERLESMTNILKLAMAVGSPIAQVSVFPFATITIC